MKKYKIVILVCAFTLLGIFIGRVSKTSNVYKENENNQMKKHVDAISMMLETEAGSGKYEMTTRDSWPTEGYVFNSTLSKCENGGELSWDDTNKKVLMSGNISDKCYVYFDIETKVFLADYVKSLYTGTQGDNNIYYHDSSLENGAGDNSYRYAGSSETTNNYVCFGSDADTCPEDNLYRIIGVFDGKVKLIKSTGTTNTLLGTDGTYTSNSGSYTWTDLDSCPSTTAYKFDNNVVVLSNKNILGAVPGGGKSGGCNMWKYSNLNSVNLNTNFITNLGIKWAALVDNATWKVSGYSTANVTAKTMYTAEITNATKTYGPSDGTSKIGLMYASDYGFAASPSAWTTLLSSYNDSSIKSTNWIYNAGMEWTMTPYSSDSYSVFILSYVSTVSNTGNLGTWSSLGADAGFGTRPAMYLNASVVYTRGSGTASDPIRIEI